MDKERNTKFPYFVGNVVLQTAYFRFPVSLVLDDIFKELTWLEKMSYVILLDKAAYSYRLGKIDEYGRPYIDDFTKKDIQSISGCSEKTAKRVLSALGSTNGIGLIESVPVPGAPNKIYVKDFTSVGCNGLDSEPDSFIYQNSLYQFQYWMIPQAFFVNEEYKDMQFESKVIYAALLARTALSSKNKWQDEEGRVYIHYSVRDLKKTFHYGTSKIVSALAELVEEGLITRFYDAPANRERIYVHNFITQRSKRFQAESLVNAADKDPREIVEVGNELDTNFDQACLVSNRSNELDRGVKVGTLGGSNQEHPGSEQEHKGGQTGNTRGVKSGTLGGSNQERIYNNKDIPSKIITNQDITTSRFDTIDNHSNLSSSSSRENAQAREEDEHVSDSLSNSPLDVVSISDVSSLNIQDIKNQVSYDLVVKEYPEQVELAEEIFIVMNNVLSGGKTYRVAPHSEMVKVYKSIDKECFELTLVNVYKSLSNIHGKLRPFIAAALFNNAKKQALTKTSSHPIVTLEIRERLNRYKDEIRELKAELENNGLSDTQREHIESLIEAKEAGLRFYGET